MPACTDRASPARSRIGISFPAVFRNFKVGTVSINISMSLTVESIPPANLAIRHIVSKVCSICRGYHVAILRRMPYQFSSAFTSTAIKIKIYRNNINRLS